MCGRFTLTQPSSAIAEQFELPQVPAWQPRYNIAPTQPVAVVVRTREERQVELFHWGLIPSWAKDLKMGARMINARAETLAEKPSFRHAFRKQRCLVIADGFYEWHRSGSTKQPYYFFLNSADSDRQLFAFAGLWEHWESGDGEINSCTIITTAPNDVMRSFHDRMPVMLDVKDHDRWLDPSLERSDQLQSLLQSHPTPNLSYYPVSVAVNNPRLEDRSCIQPLTETEKQPI